MNDILINNSIREDYKTHLFDLYNRLKDKVAPSNLDGYTLDQVFPILIYRLNKINGVFFAYLINNTARYMDTANLENWALIEALDQSLKYIPSHNNAVVYRMFAPYNSYMVDFIDLYTDFEKNVGKTFRVNHFFSTSQVNWKSKIVLAIKTLENQSRARNIENISFSPLINISLGEREVLFERGAKFIISDTQVDSKGDLTVFLNEIEINTTDMIFRYRLEKD